MHNLFLGSANLKNIWLDDSSHISRKDLQHIQDTVENCEVPKSMGRIHKEDSDKFFIIHCRSVEKWILVFSLLCLKECLPAEALECWRFFVQACHLLFQPLIREIDARAAHALLLQFCHSFKDNYGAYTVTPNMHLHTHLLECILDYGPIYSFWLFSFERNLRVLPHQSEVSIEIQVMRKFLLDLTVQELVSADEACDSSQQRVFDNLLEKRQVGYAHNALQLLPYSDSGIFIEIPCQQINTTTDHVNLEGVVCIPPYIIWMFDSDSLQYIRQAYS